MYKVVHICYSDFAGVGKKLSDAINRHSNWESIHMTFGKYGKHVLEYGYDIYIDENNINDVKKIIDSCNVIQYHSSYEINRLYGYNIPQDKIKSIYHVGSNYRGMKKVERDKLNSRINIVFVGESFRNYQSDAIILPSPIDTELYSPIQKKDNNIIIVGHSPSRRKRKGTDLFISIMEKLMNEFNNVKMSLIEGMKHNDAMKEKSKCDMFFDSIGDNYASYGQSAVEAACFGIPVFVKKTDNPNNPLIHVDEYTLYNKLKEFILDNKLRFNTGEKIREWVVEKHSEESVVEKVIKAYEEKL